MKAPYWGLSFIISLMTSSVRLLHLHVWLCLLLFHFMRGLLRALIQGSDFGFCGFWVFGFGCGVRGLGSGVWSSGFGVWSLGFGVRGLGFGVWGLGFGV